MSTSDIINAALLWHTAHERRLAIGAENRRLNKKIKAEDLSLWHPAHTQQGNAARQLTELKRRELKALRALSKACLQHRHQLDQADVIDVDVKQLASASITTEGGNAS